MQGMDAWTRCTPGILMGGCALIVLLGIVPGAHGADPTLAAVAVSEPAATALPGPLPAPPLAAAPGAASGEDTVESTLLDDAAGDAAAGPPAAESPAELAAEDDGSADDSTAQELPNWMDLAGLARYTGLWIGAPAQPKPAARPLVVPDNKHVDSVARYFLTRKRKVLEAGYRRSSRYLPTIRAIFAEEGIPRELAYLAAVESNYNPTARSHARAAGLWQFMTGTARKFGLRVQQPWYDERLDPVYSTRAAARLLAYLHDTFGSWELALAAYNAGEGRVNSAIRRARQPAGEENFWTLRRLPRETKGYVPSFFALARIYDAPETYGLAALEQEAPLELEAVQIEIATSLAELAQRLDVPLEDLRRHNPAWKRGFVPPTVAGAGLGPVLLHVPRGHGGRVAEILAKNPPRPVTWRTHTVAKGETLSEIAQVYGVSLRELLAVNALRTARLLSVGQVIALPVPAGGAAAAAPPSAPPAAVAARAAPEAESAGPKRVKAVHVVQSGESLWSIAQQYGVALGDLKRWNGLRGSRLLPDHELIVFLAR